MREDEVLDCYPEARICRKNTIALYNNHRPREEGNILFSCHATCRKKFGQPKNDQATAGLLLSGIRTRVKEVTCESFQVFSMSTGLGVGIQCLEACEDLHKYGFIHRDLKPANYACGLGDKKRVVSVDFHY